MAAARKNDIAAYMVDLVAATRDALCDDDAAVR
jgi:hypothetical protein